MNLSGHRILPAGDFSQWLSNIRNALVNENGIEVDCGECVACCSSSQFIHIRPGETQTLDRINPDILAAAPGLPKGNVLLGYGSDGLCPMLKAGKCSIYEHRPLACCNYDCRAFAAAGITADDDKTRISQQASRWKFSYPTERNRGEHLAVRAAAKFIREHAESFPGGKIPGSPGDLAVLAIKVYGVFLIEEGGGASAGTTRSDAEIAEAIVGACKEFDAGRVHQETGNY